MNEALPVPLVSVRGLVKTFSLGKRQVEVIRGMDLDIQRGDFVAIRGASGAGKSTLLHLLGGLDSPDAGQVRFVDQDLASLSSAELSRFRNLRIGFVFQAYHLLPELDALENVCLPARMARRDFDQTAAKGRDLLGRVGLQDRLDHLPAELSGGEQQRVAIARALINSPELLIADEPTGNLDSHTGDEIIALLCALRTELNTTLVIATHDARIAARAPRVVSLVDGVVETVPAGLT